MSRSRRVSPSSPIVAFAVFAAAGMTATAAPPKATSLFPSGGGRGQTVDVTVSGTFDAWPVKVWTHAPGLEIEPAADKGKLTVRIAAEAAPGLRWLRLYDDAGAADLLPFEITTIPGVAEAEPNNELSNAQAIEQLPVIVDGRFDKNGDVDGFAVKLAKGQTLVASLKGHRRGSPMDAVLQIVSPAGFVVQQCDDEIGLDPQLVFAAPEDGTYLVRGFAFPSDPNSTIGFAGGEQYLYRLTLTTAGVLDHTLPLVVAGGASGVAVETAGWNLADDVKTLPVDSTGATDRVPVWHPTLAGLAELPVVPHASIVEAEESAQNAPQAVVLPVSVSGRVQPAGDRDVYAFQATKGQTWRVRVLAGGLGSPLNPVLRVTDGAGKVLVERDATGKGGRDVDVVQTIPQDGEYRVSIHDLAEQSGPRFFYRLDIEELRPDFRLTIASDRITVEPGKPATVAVTVHRENGFDRPIELTLAGSPDTLDVPAIRDEAKAGDKPKPGAAPVQSTANLVVTMKEGAAAFSGPVTIVGRVTNETASQERLATATLSVPGEAISQAWLTVTAPTK